MMKKSLLTASVLSIIGAGVSTVALADYVNGVPVSTYCKPGFYVGVEGGRTQTNYDPNNLFIDQAVDNGGGSTSTTTNYPAPLAGSDTVSTTTITGIQSQNTDDIGIGGRVFAGYQFMPYFAAELGFTQFAKTTASGNGVAFTTSNETQTGYSPITDDTLPSGQSVVTNSQITTTTRYTADVTEHAADLVAKGTLPLPLGFGLYAKAGMAYIEAERDVNSHVTGSVESGSQHTFNATTNPISSTPGNNTSGFSNVDTYGTVYSTTYQGFRPVAGAGIDYTIPYSNFDVDVSYTRIFGSGAIPNADLAAVGINYKFA